VERKERESTNGTVARFGERGTGEMLISERMNAALNQQIGNEFSATLQYVAIAAYFDTESLPELAAHFYRQAEEERAHAMRFVRYLVAARANVHIPAIPEARSQFASAEEAVRQALEGETTVTEQINALMDLAIQEGDHLTQHSLQWFVTEQLEELSSMDSLLKMIHRAGEGGLLLVEEYLARRSPPASAAPSTPN
jgi:bacterioferritin B